MVRQRIRGARGGRTSLTWGAADRVYNRPVSPRLWVPLALVAITVLVIACGSAAGDPGSARTPTTVAGAGGGASATTAADRRGRRRPGCGRFCRQAGGFGGGPAETRDPVKVPTQTIRVARDRVFGVHATCRLNRKCIGAIIVNSFGPKFIEYGRADLRIPPHTSRKVLVPITRSGLRYLRRHGRDNKVFATVPLIYQHAPVSIHNRFTLLPPR